MLGLLIRNDEYQKLSTEIVERFDFIGHGKTAT